MTRSRIVMRLGRVGMKSTAAATSLGSITWPAATAASSFSFGQSLGKAVTTGPGAIAPTPNPVFRDLSSDRMDEGLHRMFGGRVNRLPNDRHHTGDRTGDDDVAALALDHVGQDGPHGSEGGIDIEIKHAIPSVRVALNHLATDIRAGVGVENVESAGAREYAASS